MAKSLRNPRNARAVRGWRLIDVNIAMGNLIDFVSTLRKPRP